MLCTEMQLSLPQVTVFVEKVVSDITKEDAVAKLRAAVHPQRDSFPFIHTVAAEQVLQDADGIQSCLLQHSAEVHEEFLIQRTVGTHTPTENTHSADPEARERIPNGACLNAADWKRDVLLTWIHGFIHEFSPSCF